MIDGNSIRYVQFETPQGIGYGCFAVGWSREGEELTFRVGSAFCSPKDSFSKELARTIAQGRSTTNFQFGKIFSKETGYVSDKDFGLILSEIFKNNFTVIPGWARRSFNRGKYFLTLRATRVSSGDLKAWKEAAEKAEIKLAGILAPGISITTDSLVSHNR